MGARVCLNALYTRPIFPLLPTECRGGGTRRARNSAHSRAIPFRTRVRARTPTRH